MICITGDLHGDLSRFKHPALKKLKRGDALIICGDFGFIWKGGKKENHILKKLGRKKYDILFVEGIHENFDLLEKYPVEDWCGGKTRHISGNLRQLLRGYIFKIAEKSVFSFGGGQSDENQSYLEGNEEDWIREIPKKEELARGLENLKAYDNKVDFIVTFEPPSQIAEFLSGNTDRNHINTYLDTIKDSIDYKKWFCGKQHINKLIPPKNYSIFDKIVVADDKRLPKVKKQKPKNKKGKKPDEKSAD